LSPSIGATCEEQYVRALTLLGWFMVRDVSGVGYLRFPAG
jgi:hypothetical protein